MTSNNIKINNTIIISLEALLLVGIYFTTKYSYLLFHSIAELSSIAIAFSIFMLAWNSKKYMNNNYLLFIGIAYLFVGSIDLLHTISYKGMGIFPDYDSNLATQLWIIARYMQSLSMLIAFYFLNKKTNAYILLFSFIIVSTILFLSVFYWNNFPVCYIEGKGLTYFKIISEYVISLILLVSIILLILKRDNFDKNTYLFLILSIIFSILSELAFTKYFNVYDIFNLFGHYFKIISFYLIYRAIIKTGFNNPFNLLFRDLEQTKQKYQNLVENLEDGIWAIDKDNNTSFVNPKMAEMLDYTRDEMLGINILSFIDKKDYKYAKNIFVKIKSGKKEQKELLFIKKDSTKIYLTMEISPIYDIKKKYIGALAGIKDATFAKNIENSLKKNIVEYEILVEEKTKELLKTQKELDKSKRLSDIGTLSATIAHELRNPLGVIQIAAFNIRKKSKNDELIKHIDNIEKKVSESAKIIDNLLHYSRLKMPSIEEVKIKDILSESVKSITDLYKNNNLKINRQFNNKNNLIIHADPFQLKEVFYNILDNSVQSFLEKNGIIDISVIEENNNLLITFKDNGIGIDKDDIEMVFKPFFTKKSKGTGLGLTICKEIIELHDGKIFIESIKGAGTSIIINLPIKR